MLLDPGWVEKKKKEPKAKEGKDFMKVRDGTCVQVLRDQTTGWKEI